MAAFDYHRPTTIDDAVALLAEHGSAAKVLAGGQSLVPVMAMRLSTPAHVIDVSRIDGLDRIEVDGDHLAIGAMVRQATAAASPTVASKAPLVAKALPWIGHRAIRTRGTVCGSIAHADPAAELPAVAVAAGATLVATSVRGTRTIPAAEFFTGYLSTALADDELLVAARFPAPAPRTGTAVHEVSRRHGDFALVGAAVSVTLAADGTVARAAIALFGVADTPLRMTAAEELLAGEAATADAFAAAAGVAADDLRPPSDDHASAAYRRHVARAQVARCLAEATTEAAGTEVAA